MVQKEAYKMDVIFSWLGECPIGYEVLQYTFRFLIIIVCIAGVFDLLAAWTIEIRYLGR